MKRFLFALFILLTFGTQAFAYDPVGKYYTSPPTAVNGDATWLLTDANGRQVISPTTQFMSPAGPSNIATGQVSVTTSATQVVAARAGRVSVTIEMVGAVDVFCGASGVTAGTGQLLLGTKGSSINVATSGAVFCIAASAVTVSFMENY